MNLLEREAYNYRAKASGPIRVGVECAIARGESNSQIMSRQSLPYDFVHWVRSTMLGKQDFYDRA